MSLNRYEFSDNTYMKSKNFDVSVSSKDKIIQVMDGNVLLASLSMALNNNILSLIGKDNAVVAEVELPESQLISDIYYDDKNKQIVFVINLSDGNTSKFTINIEDLLVVYEGGHGIEINNNVINIKINDNSSKYLVSDINGLSLNIDSLDETFTTDAELNSIVKNFATKNELNTKADIDELQNYLSINDANLHYAKKNEIPNLTNYLQISVAQNTYATKTELNDGLSTKQSIGDYALKSEIPNVNGFITNTVNDLVNYYKKSETYTQAEIDGKINSIITINFEVVDKLPENGKINKIYLISNTEQGEQNVKDEYIWVDEKWELIGTTKVDLSNYYNKVDIDYKLNDKVDNSTYVSDKETFALRNEIIDMATQTWVISQNYLTEHQDISQLATKTELTDGLSAKQDKGNYATVIQLDDKLDLSTYVEDKSTFATQEELNLKANSTDLNNYVTLEKAEATYAIKSEIPSLDEYLQTAVADEKYATKNELIDKADKTAIVDMLTKTEAFSTYQPKGNYLTEVPSEYITNEELNAKEYATTSQLNEKLAIEEYISDKSTFATKEDLILKADVSLLDNMLTKTEAVEIYQPKGEYLTKIPENYITIETADEKYALQTDIPNVSNFITNTVDNLTNYYQKHEVDSKLSEKVSVSTYISDKETFALKTELADKASKSELNNYITVENAESTYANKSEIPDISGLATKKDLETKANMVDIADMLTKTEASSTYQPKGNYTFIEYVEGTSDKNGYITTEIAPSNAMIIARMYLHPTLNMWCHCPSYETASNGDKIITGGIKYGVSVVVGGVTCQTFPNCKYRVYYINNI